MQKTKKKIDDIHAEDCLNSCEHILNASMDITSLYDSMGKTIREELIYFEDNEPLKIFKKAHREWEISKKNLTNIYIDLITKLGREYKDLEEIMDLIPRHI